MSKFRGMDILPQFSQMDLNSRNLILEDEKQAAMNALRISAAVSFSFGL